MFTCAQDLIDVDKILHNTQSNYLIDLETIITTFRLNVLRCNVVHTLQW